MKSKLKVLLSCFIVACSFGALAACGGSSNNNSEDVSSEAAMNEYTVTFETAGVAAQTVKEGEKAVKPADPAGYKGEDGYNYVFENWYLKDTDTVYDFEAGVMENVTLVAKFTKGTAIEYTVTFVDENGATVGTDTYTVEDKEITVPAVPQKDGYTVTWKAYELTMEDVTVEADYVAIEYTVTFVDENGATVGTDTYTVEDKEITVPAVPQKDGYMVTWKAYELAIGGVTVEADYTAIEYTLSFTNPETGLAVAESIKYTVENMSEVVFPEVPASLEIEGYKVEWNKTAEDLAIGGLDVNPVWTAKTYTITYDANGGNVENNTQSVTYGKEYTLEVPTAGKFYQEFLYWVDEEGKTLASGEAWQIASNVKLTAKYSNVINFDSMTEVPAYLQNGGRASLSIVEGNGGKVLQATSENNDQGNVRIMMPLAYMADMFADKDVQYMAFDLKLPAGATTPVSSIMYHNLEQSNYTSYETGDPGKSGSQFDTTPTDAFKSYYLPRSVYEAWVANGKTDGRFLNVQAGITYGASYWIDNIRPVTAAEYTADLYSFETGSLRNMTTEIGYCTPNYNQFHLRFTNVDAATAKFTNEIVSDGMRAIEFTKKSGETVIMFNHNTDTSIKLESRAAGYIAFDLYVPAGSDAKIKHQNQNWYGALRQGWNTVYEKVHATDNNIIRLVDSTASTYVVDNFRLLTEAEYNQAMFGFEAGGVLRDNNSNNATANGGWMYYYAGADKMNNKCSIGISEGTGANDVATLSNVRFATEKTHGGDYSLAFDKKAGYLSLHMAADSAMYSFMKNGFTFWIYSTTELNGESDIQIINGVNGKLNGGDGVTSPANTWTQVTVAAEDMHATGRFLILQGNTEGTIYLDDFQPLPVADAQ